MAVMMVPVVAVRAVNVAANGGSTVIFSVDVLRRWFRRGFRRFFIFQGFFPPISSDSDVFYTAKNGR
jgi:hypothetical protein